MNTPAPSPTPTRGPGRPRTRPDNLVRLRVDVTPEEHAILTAAARLRGESLATYARRVLTAPPDSEGKKKSGK